MSTEVEFIQQALEAARAELTGLPEKFAAHQRSVKRQTDALCEKAGIMNDIERLRKSEESAKKQIQSRADNLQGQIRVLESIYNQFHLAPIPPGVTHMYGIALEPLEPQTRLKVMHGQDDPAWPEVITTLGGDPNRRDWDGTSDPEPEPYEPPSMPEPHGYLPPDPDNAFEASVSVLDKM